MNYEVTITILNKGYIVKDGNFTTAVASGNGSELLNVLARIKQAVEVDDIEIDEEDNGE